MRAGVLEVLVAARVVVVALMLLMRVWDLVIRGLAVVEGGIRGVVVMARLVGVVVVVAMVRMVVLGVVGVVFPRSLLAICIRSVGVIQGRRVM